MLVAADADDLGAVRFGGQGRVDSSGVDAVCIDDPQKIALADAVIFHYDLAVTGQALGLHGFQRAAAEHGLLVQNGADVHQAAGAEEHFHGR